MKTSHLRRWSAPLLVAGLLAAIPAATALADGDHGGSTMPGDNTGGMPTMATHEAPSQMHVTIFVRKDSKAGWNLQLRTQRFRWAPWNASKPHIQGQGHAHLYVDGEKVTRLYGPWYFLGELEAGRHVVKVTLNGNDHGDYVHGEEVIAAQRVVNVT